MKDKPIDLFVCWHAWRPEWWHQKMCYQCTRWTKVKPIVLFVCWHAWRLEWWHQKMCHQCTRWTKALVSGTLPKLDNDKAYADGYMDGYSHGVTHDHA